MNAIANRQAPRSLYSFPELKSAEILQCLDDLRIPVTDAELQKPTSAAIQKIYEAFVDIFMGIPREQYSQVNFSGLNRLEYPDIHVDATSLLSFCRIM